ncbi:ATP synthase F1 subcomplex delta subunit [Candidatus Ruthia magnifica str. Cm (Calyptogena magnifica)]|uniref:ATP synthase subunit delta n=1 Tax=Ruthia magnifica subsp. Calyptogena magnifica TaxID=413404 RepID=ATPD_RUTMC|nr:F0F1 ATP synthase subunit delta [Candidatus Ruthturnera calyptogenae]A1AXU5.1 RecName: Full=ATP synthase subunit delta; AltName: Full=ATP synthase F(1) sector subunit delta; AltName: Full=F-type ATPase subunit delta; Short=F-ATPase subunit delta [Candidatus Ruthia magnifica str. Cm (Calyptogena magnifica)]ABL02752.1 ATP synthase F1 subcomplex delta subunit [Candidatus Ruthia magnifica str. Cm (Calyptogena magnifica)]
MELVVIAKPYANAIFELAQQDKSYLQWKMVLDAGAQLLIDEQMCKFIAFPNVLKQDKLSVIKELLKSILARELSGHEVTFIGILLNNNRINALPSIATLFESLINTTNDAKMFNVISAYQLSELEKKQIVRDLTNQYNKVVNIDAVIDKDLVGGVIIKDGDKVIDMSIKARVNELELRLSKTH